MIIHRLIATAVLIVLMYYLCAVLGWDEVERRMDAFDWLRRPRYGSGPFLVYFFTLLGWVMVVFSHTFEDWLSDVYYHRLSPYVVGGWFCMLTPFVAMLWHSIF